MLNENSRLIKGGGGGNVTLDSRDYYHVSEEGASTEASSSLTSSSRPNCGFSKSLVLGGIDGIIASFVIVSAAEGAQVAWRIIFSIGLAALIANGFSIGMNEYFSSKSHREFIQSEKRRATWQYKNFKKDEIDQMVERLELNGMARNDARTVADKLGNYESIFINHVLVEELGLQLPDDDDAALLVDSFVMLLSHVLVGSAPLWIYGTCLALDPLNQTVSEASLYLWSAAMTAAVIASLGCVKSSYSASYWVYSVAETLALTILCSGLAYYVGGLLGQQFL